MGVDIADFDDDGNEDIFLTHLTREKSTLFVNRGEGYFEDRSVEAGVAAPSMPFTGFGTAFFDYDNDGWLDIVAANGAVHLIEELRAPQDPYPLQQKKQLFHNLGNGRFEETTAAAGQVSSCPEVGRGLAAGDLDNDGDTDLVVSNNNGPLRVLINKVGSAQAVAGIAVAERQARRVRREGRDQAQRGCRRSGAAFAPTAAISRPTIRGSSWAWARPRRSTAHRVLARRDRASGSRCRRCGNTRRWSRARASRIPRK